MEQSATTTLKLMERYTPAFRLDLLSLLKKHTINMGKETDENYKKTAQKNH